jgi:hypothetical protein
MAYPMEEGPADRPHWTLDRRVPIAIILSLIIQTLGAVWWAASFSASMEARVNSLEATNEAKSNLGERMASVEAQLGFINGAVARIENKIDRAVDGSQRSMPGSNYGKK